MSTRGIVAAAVIVSLVLIPLIGSAQQMGTGKGVGDAGQPSKPPVPGKK
jgi:hypothetical protein